MSRPQLTDREVFRLARYAYSTLAPLMAELREIEPSVYYSIELRFPTEDSVFNQLNGVQVSVHWARGDMPVNYSSLRSTDDIDAEVVDVRNIIEKLRADVLADAVMAVL